MEKIYSRPMKFGETTPKEDEAINRIKEILDLPEDERGNLKDFMKKIYLLKSTGYFNPLEALHLESRFYK